MKNIILGTKVYSRNENEIYPNCKTCGNELSPFVFKSDEISVDLMIQFEKADLVLEKGRGEMVILMCKTCCKHIGMEV